MNNTHARFNNNIANRYGTVWLEKTKEFLRLRVKRKKLECSLDYVVKCRDSDVIPKFARIKPVNCIRDCLNFFQVANNKLLRRIIAEQRQKLMYTNKKMYELHLQLSRVLSPGMWEVLDTMSFNRAEKIKENTNNRHHKKLTNLQQQSGKNRYVYPHDRNVDGVTAHSMNSVVNLSSCQLNDFAIRVLSRGLNFAPTPRRTPVENIITSVENTVIKNRIPHHDAECIRQDISSLLRKSKPPKSNISKEEILALKDLRNNEEILVLPADKGNATVVVNTEEYEQRIEQMVSDDKTYKKVKYNPTSRVTTKVVKLLQSFDSGNLLARLRPHNPTSPKIYGLPKIHKPGWPLRPIVSQIDAPTYKISKYMATILQPLTGKTSSYVRDSRHFVQLLAEVRIAHSEVMVSFDVSSLFTSVPVEDTITIISRLIQETSLPSDYIEWVRYCLKSGYFLWRGDHYLQVDGVAMGSPIAPVVANIFMEWFEGTALSTAPAKPRFWWRYVDDVFAIISKDALEGFTAHLNTVHQNISFTVEAERDGVLPFLDVRVIRESDGRLTHTVYRKPTHTDRYLQADSHHHPAHLASVPRALINRALSLCDPQYIDAELEHVRRVLENNGFGWRQCSRLVNGSERMRPATVERSPIYLPFIKGITDKIGYLLQRRYGIKTIFRPQSQLRQMLRSPKDKEPLNGPGVYKIPCDCGKSYIGETRRNIATRLTEHIRSIKNLDTNKSAIAEHVLTEGTKHFIRFDKASVLAREKYFVPRKVREAIEINRHPNFNRDSGWTLPPAWTPLLNVASTSAKPFVREFDTVCDYPTRCVDVCDASGSDNDGASALSPERRSPPAPAPPLSRRATRALARSSRQALAATARTP